MSHEKIEISLNSVDNEDVNLERMSLKSLESFLNVTTSLKNIAESISDNITFTIRKGSAYAAVNGPKTEISRIFNSIDTAIKGESKDDLVTSNLRNIQKEIQDDVFGYQFKYSGNDISERIIKAKRIAKKRSRDRYKSELTVLTGFFNSIGGTNPNYHFDSGAGVKKVTIECTVDNAKELKEYLYENISCLVYKSYSESNPQKFHFKHCSILSEDQVQPFKEFTKNLLESGGILERLDSYYEFIEKSSSKTYYLKILMEAFLSGYSDLNELKTTLIISEGLKNHPELKSLRSKLEVKLAELL